MLLSPKKASKVISENERLINDHLLLLVCRPSQAYDRGVRVALIRALEEVADMRFGDPPQPGTADYYISLLYREPFDLAPTANVTYRMSRLQQLYYPVWIERDPAFVAEQLRAFHNEFGHGCERGGLTKLEVTALVDQFVEWVK
jgi:hypothetical protein